MSDNRHALRRAARASSAVFGAAALAFAAAAVATAARPQARPPIVFATAPGMQDVAVHDGARTRLLTRTAWYEGMPAWSPDRRRIAFVAARGGDADIWVMNADGTNVRRLAGGSGRRADDLYPTWSPDGRLIAFSSRRDGSGHVYVMRADGSGVRRLTREAAGVENTQPVFSPDGSHVVFSSTRGSGRYALYRVRVADGGGIQRLTAGRDEMTADVRRDGRLVFTSRPRRGGRASIWTADSDGRNPRRVVAHPDRDLAFPRFSRDGRTILYTALKATETEIDSRLWVVGSDGSGRTHVGRGTEGDW